VGPVGGKGRPSVGKVGEWYVEGRHLQSYIPRLCRLRTDGLIPASKYWTYWSHVGDMGPVSLVDSCQQKLIFSPTASLAIVGEKLGTDLRIRRSSSCELCQEPFFSGVVDLYKSVDDFTKVCYTLTVWDTYCLGPYADWVWDACDVSVGLSPTVCTLIRITVTLKYEYRLFTAVIT
jgi:hypothetical protein